MKKFKHNPANSSSQGPAEIEEGYFKPLQVEVGNNFERAFRNFRQMVQAEQVVAEWKRRQSYEKPSQRRRREKNEALQRAFEEGIKAKKLADGSFAREQEKKQQKKEQRLKARYERIQQEGKGSE